MTFIAQTTRFSSFGYPSFFRAWDFYACQKNKAVDASKQNKAYEQL